MALAVIGALVVGLVILIGRTLTYLQPVLVPLAVAGILAYLLNPLVVKLEQKGLSRLRAILSVFTGSALLLGSTLLVISPKIASQAGELFEKREQLAGNLVQHIRTTPWLRDLANQALEIGRAHV